jgi:aldehyde dehydrogenase (NAD+)
MNSGQACVADTRLVVPESRLDEIKKALPDAVPAFKVGDPAEPGVAIDRRALAWTLDDAARSGG